jgi:hypothetical protein
MLFDADGRIEEIYTDAIPRDTFDISFSSAQKQGMLMCSWARRLGKWHADNEEGRGTSRWSMRRGISGERIDRRLWM